MKKLRLSALLLLLILAVTVVAQASQHKINSKKIWTRTPERAGAILKKNSIMKPAARAGIDVKINEKNEETIVAGDNFELSISFSTGSNQAQAAIFYDINNNNTLDDGDIDLEDVGTLSDNDPADEDPANGIYQLTLSGNDDGPYGVAGITLFFYASDDGGNDYAKLHITQEQSPYSISGTMTPAVPHLLVLAYPIDNKDDEYMIMSNAQGSYQLFLPAAGYYNVRSFDPIGLYSLTTEDSYDNLFVDGQLGNIDFTFFEGTSAIYGYLTDDNGSPLADVEIYAYNDNGGGSINGTTDDSGYYRLSVSAGEWYLEADKDDLIPAYLVAGDEEVTVAEEDSVMHNITVYQTDAQITGNVFLNGEPYSIPVTIDCWSQLGYTETLSGSDGSYTLMVSSKSDAENGYYLELDIDELPQGVYVEEHHYSIMSGSTDIDFHIITVSGGLRGTVFDSQTLDPIDDAYLNFSNDSINTSTDSEDGADEAFLPEGTYQVWIDADNYSSYQESGIVAGSGFTTKDFYLTPLGIDDNLIIENQLFQNYPNPFNPETTIKFSIKEDSPVKLSFYNYRGELVAVPLNSSLSAGIHQISWDGSNLSSGIYFYKIETKKFTDLKRAILIK